MTNYEKLRTRINELLPDRLKLEFGCEVRDKGGVWIFARSIVSTAGQRINVWRPESGIGVGKTEEFEILGKPLTIEDVLRSLDFAGKSIAITTNGRFGINYREKSVGMAIQGAPSSPYDMPEQTGFITLGFDLTKPLSAPENDEACEKVLELLTV